MTYAETLDYLYAQLPMFHRVGAAAYKPSLDNTIALLQAVHNPHQDLPCVHIAGTNGKGSTSHLIASALQEAGYKTGLYTSPHLVDFRERIRIDGKKIPQQDIIDFVEKNKGVWENIAPSFFEMTVALAFWFFQKEKVDIAVIEVGLGGRLDSTNVIEPELSVITNIGFDHMHLLGDTIEKIASEKAGIIKRNTPVVIGPMREEAASVMLQTAQQYDAPLLITSRDLSVPFCPLGGKYQEENTRTALTALRALAQRSRPLLTEDIIAKGFQNVVPNTGLMGRWQQLQSNPLVLVDVGHNEDGIQFILRQLEETPHRTLHFVLGMVNDKDIDKILTMLPTGANYYFCKANIPRGLDATLLKEKAQECGLNGEVYTSVEEAFLSAKKIAQTDDLVFVGGSFFTVAEVLPLYPELIG